MDKRRLNIHVESERRVLNALLFMQSKFEFFPDDPADASFAAVAASAGLSDEECERFRLRWNELVEQIGNPELETVVATLPATDRPANRVRSRPDASAPQVASTSTA